MSIELEGVILHVDDLDRALDFYTQLLDFRVTTRTPDAAMLASASGTSKVAFRERQAEHYTDRTVQALVWRIPTLAGLSELAQRLERLNARAVNRTIDEEGLTLLSVRDPDGQRLLFVHHAGGDNAPRNIPAEAYWY